MKDSQLQFTLRALLLATFWVAVMMGALVIAKRADYAPPQMLALVVAGVVGPIIVVGTLLGSPTQWLVAGAFVIFGLAILLLLSSVVTA
ncbi:MAG: hypothetical protein K8T25_07270 [Planctomycetia bacterium]|nr:hypothetical protein [Planctomycetia bacterium]